MTCGWAFGALTNVVWKRSEGNMVDNMEQLVDNEEEIERSNILHAAQTGQTTLVKSRFILLDGRNTLTYFSSQTLFFW